MIATLTKTASYIHQRPNLELRINRKYPSRLTLRKRSTTSWLISSMEISRLNQLTVNDAKQCTYQTTTRRLHKNISPLITRLSKQPLQKTIEKKHAIEKFNASILNSPINLITRIWQRFNTQQIGKRTRAQKATWPNSGRANWSGFNSY